LKERSRIVREKVFTVLVAEDEKLAREIVDF
jgi:hypothetical protein